MIDEQTRQWHTRHEVPAPGCNLCLAQTAIAFALEELRKWPDLPGVSLGIVLSDPDPLAPNRDPDAIVPTRPLVIPAERFVGVFEALRVHALDCWPVARRSIRAYYAVQDVAARLRRDEDS